MAKHRTRGQSVAEDIIGRLDASPHYHSLVRRRSRLGWLLASIMLGAFTVFTLLMAFEKQWMASPIGTGVTSIGVPIGMGLILFAIALTGLYVWRCNTVYDRELALIVAEVSA
tara:strand:+ start:702 stop:1040 length:339 start_codon:yes stop_codon:yes gene_type:complete